MHENHLEKIGESPGPGVSEKTYWDFHPRYMAILLQVGEGISR